MTAGIRATLRDDHAQHKNISEFWRVPALGQSQLICQSASSLLLSALPPRLAEGTAFRGSKCSMLRDKQLAGALMTGVAKARQVARWIWCGPRQALKQRGESKSKGYYTLMGITDYSDTAQANYVYCKHLTVLWCYCSVLGKSCHEVTFWVILYCYYSHVSLSLVSPSCILTWPLRLGGFISIHRSSRLCISLFLNICTTFIWN